jgi:hypothetical protein
MSSFRLDRNPETQPAIQSFRRRNARPGFPGQNLDIGATGARARASKDHGS